MKKTFILIILTSIGYLMYGQQPSLVSDLEAGSDHISYKFKNSNFKGGYINDSYVFAIGNDETGEELYLLKDKSMTLLKDITEGSSDSYLSNFINMGSKLYFQSRSSIWSSDGTEEGTILEIDEIDGDIIVGGNDALFYSKNDSIFTISNLDVITGYPFESYTTFKSDYKKHNTSNVASYKEGLVYVSGGSIKTTAYYLAENSFQEIKSIDNSEYFEVRLTASFGEGFTFSLINSGGGKQSTYSFVDTDNEFVKIKSSLPKYAVTINNESCFLIDEFSVELYNIDNPRGLEIESDAAEFYSYFEHNTIGESIIYHNKEKSDSHTINVCDGQTTTEILETENDYLSNIISKGDFSFFASGIRSGRKPYLYVYNNNTSEASILYEFDKFSSSLKSSVYPICFLNGTLYFLYSLESDYGQEVFSLDFPNLISSTTTDLVNHPEVSQTGRNSFKIIGDNKGNRIFNVIIYDMSGRKISSFESELNQEFLLKNISGLYIVTVENSNKSYSKKVLISN